MYSGHHMCILASVEEEREKGTHTPVKDISEVHDSWA